MATRSPHSTRTASEDEKQMDVDKADEKQLPQRDYALARCTTYQGVRPMEEATAVLATRATRRIDPVLMPILALTVMLQCG